jgi:hypothetical protein
MPIPSSIADLSTTAASNSPLGNEPPTEGDNHIRALAAIVKQVYEDTTLVSDLESTSSTSVGAGIPGFLWSLNYAANTVGWGLMTARYSILKYIPVAQWAAIFAGTSTYDATADIASALAAEKLITLPPGLIRGEWNLTSIRGVTIRGAGRDSVGGTRLHNVDNTAVFTLNNTSSDCKNNTFEDFCVINRDEATYTTCDAFLISGVDSNENDFHVFRRVDVVDMRYGWSVTSRTIWDTFDDCHASSCVDGFHLDTTHNVSQLTFRTCRFGAGTGYGLYATHASGDALSGWSFINCTFEKNALNGVRISGAASGISGWAFEGCYMEENTTSVAISATNPRKANIFIESSSCIGLVVNACALYGAAGGADALDWGIYISSTTVSGHIGPCRPGTYTLGFAQVTNGQVLVDPQDGGTGTLSGDGVLGYVGEVRGDFTGSLTGCTTVPTGTIEYSMQRNQVTLDIPVIEATSNTTAATITGMPAAIRPDATRTCLVAIKDNGTIALGLAQIDSAGTITLQNGIGGGSFTNSGTKGVRAQSITYLRE